jgi:L-2-hydroxyglutarate oxidase LhgO
VDLGGSVKFGPYWEYVDEIEYSVDESQRDLLIESIRTYLPAVTKESLEPSMSGIRARIQGPDDPYRDFIIKDEADSGYPGFINLIGIECPGLTDSIPIARYVASLLEAYQ